MPLENVKAYFESVGLGDRVKVFRQSSATVREAALAVGCEPARIAKTLSFLLEDGAVLIVAAGDAKVDNKMYKGCFHQKAKMIPADEVQQYTGHTPGGVCPFEVKEGVRIFLDVSLKRFHTVYPAAGSASSAVELSVDELQTHSHCAAWVDVCKGWREQADSNGCTG